MKIGARNVFRGSIVNIEIGAVKAQVTIRIAPDPDVADAPRDCPRKRQKLNCDRSE